MHPGSNHRRVPHRGDQRVHVHLRGRSGVHVMEQQVFAKMFSQLGWSEQEVHDGIFCPGGSMSNMYGMNLARFSLCRRLGIDVKRQGMAAVPRLAAFYSEQGHYSIQK